MAGGIMGYTKPVIHALKCVINFTFTSDYDTNNVMTWAKVSLK